MRLGPHLERMIATVPITRGTLVLIILVSFGAGVSVAAFSCALLIQ